MVHLKTGSPGDPSTVRPDWLLATFVNVVNTTNIELGVTLTVHGQIVSGLLVSGKKFLLAIGEQLAAGWGESDAALPEEMFVDTAEAIYGRNPGDKSDSPKFIHIKEAKFFGFGKGARVIPSHGQGLWWRGRLAEVDGFTVGLLSLEGGGPPIRE